MKYNKSKNKKSAFDMSCEAHSRLIGMNYRKSIDYRISRDKRKTHELREDYHSIVRNAQLIQKRILPWKERKEYYELCAKKRDYE